ncbi:MAG: Zn-dependent protease [Phenylobacterium sp.]|nr:Zn-dependent protease [Phenylobacterium sp.]
MANVVTRLRNSRETTYGLMMIVFGALLWVLLIWGVWRILVSGNQQLASLLSVYIGYGTIFFVGYLIANAAYRAQAFGNMLLLGPQQFPQLHAMVVDGAAALGMQPPPRAFVFNSNGLFNAFARRLLGGRYLFLTSALLEAEDDEQVRFIIGHELGHHAAGHLNPWKNFLKFPAHVVPFLGPAYSRAREYTCDAIGAELTGDVGVSRSSLQMLGCGCGRLNGSMNCEAFMAQEAMVPPIFGFLTEIFRSHPRLTRRIRAIRAKS